MKIDEIRDGIVLDHISVSNGMKIYSHLGLDTLDCTVAMIRNVKSLRMGRKDLIKIDRALDVNLDILGYIDPGITVNIVRGGVITEKKRLALPEKLENVIICKNPRCITVTEPSLKKLFRLSDRQKGSYRCEYCESENK